MIVTLTKNELTTAAAGIPKRIDHSPVLETLLWKAIDTWSLLNSKAKRKIKYIEVPTAIFPEAAPGKIWMFADVEIQPSTILEGAFAQIVMVD